MNQSTMTGSVGSTDGGMAEQAKEQASQVGQEVREQARSLLDETRSQVADTASEQRKRAVESLHGVAQELGQMASRSEQDGMATELVRQSSQRLGSLAHYLEQREPGDLLEELRGFARRKPGVFVAGALAAGVLAGRLTKAAVAAGDDQSSPNGRGTGVRTVTPTPEAVRSEALRSEAPMPAANGPEPSPSIGTPVEPGLRWPQGDAPATSSGAMGGAIPSPGGPGAPVGMPGAEGMELPGSSSDDAARGERP